MKHRDLIEAAALWVVAIVLVVGAVTAIEAYGSASLVPLLLAVLALPVLIGATWSRLGRWRIRRRPRPKKRFPGYASRLARLRPGTAAKVWGTVRGGQPTVDAPVTRRDVVAFHVEAERTSTPPFRKLESLDPERGGRDFVLDLEEGSILVRGQAVAIEGPGIQKKVEGPVDHSQPHITTYKELTERVVRPGDIILVTGMVVEEGSSSGDATAGYRENTKRLVLVPLREGLVHIVVHEREDGDVFGGR